MKPLTSEKRGKTKDPGQFHSERFVIVINFLIPLNFYYCLLLMGFLVQKNMGHGQFEPFRYLGMLVFFLALYGISRREKQLWKIVILSALVILAAFYLYPLPYSKIWFAVTLIIFTAVEIFSKGDWGDFARGITWFVEHSVYWGVAIWVLMAASLFAGGNTAESKGDAVLCTKLMLVVFCVFLAEYLVQQYFYLIYDYFRRMRQMDRFDKNHVWRMVAMGMVCGAGVAGAIYIGSRYASYILDRIFIWIVSLWNSLWGRFTENAGYGALPATTASPQSSSGDIKGNGRELLKQITKNPMIARVANLLLTLLLVGICLLVLYYIYRYLRTVRYDQTEEDDVITVLDKGSEEAIAPEGVRQRFRYGNSAAQRIRRYYRKFVERRGREKKIRQLRRMTPSELEKSMSRSALEKEPLGEFTELYEEARYSRRKIEEKQAARAKELYEQLK